MANAKSLRQSRRRPNANTAAAMNAFRDAIFEEHCGDKCLSVLRIVYSLRHYHLLLKAKKKVDNDRTLFIEWCDSVYTAALLLDDYVHVMSKHNDITSLSAMARQIKCPCSGAAECEWTGRHFRGRGRDKAEKNAESVHFYIELMDTLHFNIFHLKEVGLRIDVADAKTDAKAEDDDEDTLVDAEMLRIRDIIKLKREQYTFDRMDSADTNKFTIVGTQKGVKDDEEGNNQLMMEGMLEFINADVAGAELLKRYVVRENYDSESVEIEVNLFIDRGAQSNLLQFAESHSLATLTRAIANFFREFRASKSFSTGIIFWYWPWHREAKNQKQIKHNPNYGNMDFGGHSISDLCVRPHFASLKEEAIESGEVDIKDFNATVVEKAKRYLNGRKCRAMRSRYDVFQLSRFQSGSPLSLHHIQSVLLYTDFTHFSALFSSSFRKLRWNESIRETNQRNGRFFHVAKALRECVELFGHDNGIFEVRESDGELGSRNGRESGPFFTGVSVVLNIPSFAINFQGPTSTSKQFTVALRFAGDDGLILRLNNDSDASGRNVAFWNASCMSRYPEEDERIFFASQGRLALDAIFVVGTAKDYKCSVSAFYKFDQILTGRVPHDNDLTSREFRIVKQAVDAVLGRSNEQTLDAFVLHNFMAFARRKTRVVLNLMEMTLWQSDWWMGSAPLEDLIWNYRLNDLIVHPLIENVEPLVYPSARVHRVDEKILDDANCIKPLLFELFPDHYSDADHYSSTLEQLQFAVAAAHFEDCRVSRRVQDADH